MAVSSVILTPFTEIALPSKAFLASVLEVQRLVLMSISRIFWPRLVVGKNLAKESKSAEVRAEKSAFLSNRRFVSFSAVLALSLPWTTEVDSKASVRWARRFSGDLECSVRTCSIFSLPRVV